MTTIEERAAAFAERRLSPRQTKQSMAICYINGALEQRKIDIEKACKWLNENDGKYQDSTREEYVEQFKKAMLAE